MMAFNHENGKYDSLDLIGETIKIISMEGEPSYNGKTGVVKTVDSMGQLHGTWGGLAIQPENDTFEVVE